MSPEQAKGKSVDKRADIWAYGCILYECLAGRRAFEGETVTETLASVIKEEPDFGLVPANARLLVQKCLAKDLKTRLRDIGDGMVLLESSPGSKLDIVAAKHSRLPYVIAGIFFLVALFSVYLLLWPESSDNAAPMRVKIKLPEAMKGDSGLVLSPDGRYLAFSTAGGESRDRLWIHDLQTDRTWPLQGTNAALLGVPLWSPDSRFIVISDAQELKKIDVTSGQSVKLCDYPTHALGGFWTQNDTIVFGTNGGSIMKIPASGGTPVPVTTREKDLGSGGHFYPSLLPDGKHFLYVRESTIGEDEGIYVGSLDVKPEDQKPVLVLKDARGPVYYMPSKDSGLGRLIFWQDQKLLACKFNEKLMVPAGDPVQIVDQLGSWWSAGLYSVSSNGLLVYGGQNISATQYSWYDREGKIKGKIGVPDDYLGVALSPDMKQIAVGRNTGEQSPPTSADIWLFDSSGDDNGAFTFGRGINSDPVWSPDGERIIFYSNRNGKEYLYQKLTSGIKDEEVLIELSRTMYPSSWSSNGDYLLVTGIVPDNLDVLLLPMKEDEPRLKPLLNTDSIEINAHFSPDMKWIAYQSDKTGNYEIWVEGFLPDAEDGPSLAGRWRVSREGGTKPRWNGDASELYYLSPDGAVMAVSIESEVDGALSRVNPVKLFDFPDTSYLDFVNFGMNTWDVHSNGNLFLLPTQAESKSTTFLNVIINWTSLLEK